MLMCLIKFFFAQLIVTYLWQMLLPCVCWQVLCQKIEADVIVNKFIYLFVTDGKPL